GEPVRAKEWWRVTCRDWRRRRPQTRGEVVLSALAAAASRRGRLRDVPTGKAACSCQALFPAEPPRTRGLQKACPPDRFGCSILSARELHTSLRFPWLHLLSTTPSHLYFGKVFPNMGAPLFDCSSVASSSMTSQCSARTPFSMRTISAAIQLTGRPIFENRPCKIAKSPSATMVPRSYLRVGGRLLMRSKRPSRPGSI